MRTKYSESIKASVLAKVLAPNAASIVELAKELNIPTGTIYTWMHHMRNKHKAQYENVSQRPSDKSPESKLKAVIDTMGKTEQELGAYCREHGIYFNHLETWKKQMLDGLGAVNTKQHKAENQQIQKEVKQLQKDLRRKDKALAEVSALLILKKKADLLWGADEDAS